MRLVGPILYGTAQDIMQVTLIMISESHHQTHQFEDPVTHEHLHGSTVIVVY